MILNNRKDTYDIKLSRRQLHEAGRCAARSGPVDAGAHRQAGASGARCNPRAQRVAYEVCTYSPRTGCRITNRALRGPSDGANRYRFLAGSPDPATSSKRQASSSKQQAFFQSIKPQAASVKLQAASSKLLDRAAFIKFNDSLLVVLGYDERVRRVLDMERNLMW